MFRFVRMYASEFERQKVKYNHLVHMKHSKEDRVCGMYLEHMSVTNRVESLHHMRASSETLHLTIDEHKF